MQEKSHRGADIHMGKLSICLTLLTATFSAAGFSQDAGSRVYPPIEAYLMPQKAEIALARSAAPTNISSHATINVFTAHGFETVHKGDNGFVCLVMRGFTGAPTFRPLQIRDALTYDPKTLAPICLNPQAVEIVLPYYELRTKLGIEGKSPSMIADAVRHAYEVGALPKRDRVSFGYMWSADQVLGPAGHWHPHVMVYAPNYENAMLGGNPPGAPLPEVSDDDGSPFSVVVIPVDPSLAIKATEK
jgi:hypothetical protein